MCLILWHRVMDIWLEPDNVRRVDLVAGVVESREGGESVGKSKYKKRGYAIVLLIFFRCCCIPALL